MLEAFVFMFFILVFGVVDETGLIDNYSDAETEEMVNWSIPASVALGEV